MISKRNRNRVLMFVFLGLHTVLVYSLGMSHSADAPPLTLEVSSCGMGLENYSQIEEQPL